VGTLALIFDYLICYLINFKPQTDLIITRINSSLSKFEVAFEAPGHAFDFGLPDAFNVRKLIVVLREDYVRETPVVTQQLPCVCLVDSSYLTQYL